MKLLIALMIVMSLPARADTETVYSDSVPDQVRDVADAFEPIVARFEEEFSVKVRFPVRFYIAKDSSVGQCASWRSGARMVRIDVRRYPPLTDSQKEMVIYHELGHCVLNLEHDAGTTTFDNVKGEWPRSIMHPMMFDEIEALVYKTNRKYYIKELKDAAR